MRRRAITTVWVLLLLLLPWQAVAQPAPNRYDAVAQVDAACPGLVQSDHAFTDAVFEFLHRQDPRWGRNGKRGNPNDLSHDAGAFINPASPFGVSIVDIIVAAGGPNARPAWQDVTQATITAGTVGVWVRPSGVLPACLSGSTPPPPVPTPVPPVTTPVPVDLTPVLTALARLQADVDELKGRPLPEPAPPDMGLLNTYIDQMIGNGPGEGMPNHVTNLTQRLEVLRVQLEQLDSWIRGRRVLRY